jgi:hypothetical protein
LTSGSHDLRPLAEREVYGERLSRLLSRPVDEAEVKNQQAEKMAKEDPL